MNDRVLVEALRARDPGALAALYDAYAERIYRYCWSLLMSTDSAQVALRDTLIAAEAHAGALSDPDKLRPWLYALARGECLRRRMATPPDADEALAETPVPADPGDADLRVMAWNATQGLPAQDREVLELGARHDLSTSELAAVLGVAPRQVEVVQEEARERLRDAITAEILARKGPYDCPRRARILSGFAGELTQDMREQLVRHVQRCETCSPHRTRQVSAAKVFELLPRVTLPDVLRVRVMSCFIDPELLPYRRYVARRTGALDAAGFPVTGEKKARKWPQALAGALAAVATVVAIAVIFQQFGGERGGLTGIASGAFPATGEPPGIRLPWMPEPQDSRVVVEPILDSTATYPIGAQLSTGPITLTTPDTGPTRAPAPESTHTSARPTNTPKPPPSTEEPPPNLGSGEPTIEPQEGPPMRRHHDHGTRTPCPTDRPTTPTPTPTPTPTKEPTPTQSPTQGEPTKSQPGQGQSSNVPPPAETGPTQPAPTQTAPAEPPSGA